MNVYFPVVLAESYGYRLAGQYSRDKSVPNKDIFLTTLSARLLRPVDIDGLENNRTWWTIDPASRAWPAWLWIFKLRGWKP